MHRADPAAHHSAGHAAPTPQPDAAERCVMRGTCEGPSLFTLFSNPGMLPDVTVPVIRIAPPLATVSLVEGILDTPVAPDPRPPRI